MKYLYSLLLFISCGAFGQGFGYSSSSIGFFNNATVTINSTTYTAGNTYLFFIGTSANATTPTDNPTISSGSLTMVKQGTVASGNKRIIVYSCSVSSTTTTSITFTYAEAQLVHSHTTYSTTSLDTHTNISIASNSGSTADPLITLSSTANSYTIAYFMNDKNPFGGTVESGWTEDLDIGNPSGPTGIYGYHRNSTTDNTAQVTSAAANWLGIGIQYSQPNRRIFIIN